MSHLTEQERFFDSIADSFQPSLPSAVEARHREVVRIGGVNAQSFVLDVASGKGALIGPILAAGVRPERLFACDLSARMLAIASGRFPAIPREHFIHAPIEDYLASTGMRDATTSGFDCIFMNGCFGNFVDQRSVLMAACTATRPGGSIVISHPLGVKFVAELHRKQPMIVPQGLPDIATLNALLEQTPGRVQLFRDDDEFYVAQILIP